MNAEIEPRPAEALRDRIVELRRVRASSLIANPQNFREHPEAQREALRGVLGEIGLAAAAIAREDENGELHLIDGHLRASELGDEQMPVLVLDVDEAEANLLLATLDPMAAMAKQNSETLATLLESFDKNALNLTSLVMPETKLKRLLDRAESGDARELPSLPDKPITQAGDIIYLGEHRLLCGDCRDAADMARLMNGEKINVAVTSPPYAERREYDATSGFHPIAPEAYIDWFEALSDLLALHLADDGSFFLNIKEHCESGQRSLYVKDLTLAMVRSFDWRLVEEYAWTHNGTPRAPKRRFKNGWEPIFHFTRNEQHKFRPDNVRHESQWAVAWEGKSDGESKPKKPDLGMSSSQGVQSAVRARREDKGHYDEVPGLAYPSNSLSFGKNRDCLGHAAAYPIRLPQFFIQAHSDEGDLVLDPFAGSGSTLIACENTDRVGLMMEISPAYCDVIVNRWQALTGEAAERISHASG